MTERSGLRERKKRRTRRDLEEAALRLFAQQGFANTTVEEIAAAADVSPRTFFHYFGSKEDVVLTDHERRLERIRNLLLTCPADEPPMVLARQAIRAALADLDEDRETQLQRRRLIEEEPAVLARSHALQDAWGSAIAGAIAERLGVDPDADLRPRLVAGVALAVERTAVALWAASGGEASLDDLVARAFALVSEGLGGVGDRAPEECAAHPVGA